jgi:hypothetical protein
MTLGTRVAVDARVEVDGDEVRPADECTYLLLNKPVGVVTTMRDRRAAAQRRSRRTGRPARLCDERRAAAHKRRRARSPLAAPALWRRENLSRGDRRPSRCARRSTSEPWDRVGRVSRRRSEGARRGGPPRPLRRGRHDTRRAQPPGSAHARCDRSFRARPAPDPIWTAAPRRACARPRPAAYRKRTRGARAASQAAG